MRRRAVVSVLIFAAGVSVGCGLMAGYFTSRDAAAPAPPVSEVLAVRGQDLPEAIGVADPSGPGAASPPLPLLEEAREVAPALASTRGVAREALSVTAWIRGAGIYGAGVVIADHYVLTCLHVVEKMRSIELSVAEGPFRPARIVERDRSLDLAVLHVEEVHAKHARIASAAQVQMGDPVFAMGAPRRMHFSLTSGIVSYAGRPYGHLYYLQTDIPTNGGNSGGPVLDQDGRVVGISSFILRDSQGLAFALPIDYAYRRFQARFAHDVDVPRFEAWLAERSARSFRMPAAASRYAATHTGQR